MTTFYLDYEGGNDANDGTSFANRWKTITSGATAARIAPGDTIRVMGSPAPTSLGITGTWTDGALPSGRSISSSTNASPIVVTTSSAHGFSNGDSVVIGGHLTNTNANGYWTIANVTSTTFELVGSTGNGVGSSGTVRKINVAVVTLASALTQTVASTANRGQGRVAWTASANVTTSLDTTDFKAGDCSDSIAIGAAFTTGLAAYVATGTLDLSGYKQLSFWVMQRSGSALTAAAMSLKLCSDAAGAVPVDTIDIPAVPLSGAWQCVTVNVGSAMGSSIRSIALYVNTDNGAQTIMLSNIIACKDATSNDSLNLRSLIGKNTGTENWYCIQAITGTMVLLDLVANSQMNATGTSLIFKGYVGTTETVATYKRETIATNASVVQSVQDSGTAGNLISFEGGWDRTDMSTQTLETWFDGQAGQVNGLTISGKSYVHINNFGFVRYLYGVHVTSTSHHITAGTLCGLNSNSDGLRVDGSSYEVSVTSINAANNNSSSGIVLSSAGTVSITTVTAANGNSIESGITVSASHKCRIGTLTKAANNTNYGIRCNNSSTANYFGTVTATRNDSGGVIFDTAHHCVIDNLTSQSNTSYGLAFASAFGNKINTLTTGSNTLAAVRLDSFGENYLRKATLAEATEVSISLSHSNAHNYVFVEREDNTADNHQIYTSTGTIVSNTSVRHTASGISWALSPTSSDYRTSNNPLVLSLAKVAVAANALVTVKVWMRRTNTGLTMRLVCKGGQIAGVASDVTSSMSAAADTWEEITITFTPTEAGVVEIQAEAYGGTTYTGYVDDMTITQA